MLADLTRLGYTPSGKSTDATERQVAQWCSARRRDYMKNQLDQWLIDALEALPFWSWDPVLDNHKRMLADLISLGYTPSVKSTDATKKKVGTWCSARRRDYMKNILDQWLIDALEALPFWSWNGRFNRTK